MILAVAATVAAAAAVAGQAGPAASARDMAVTRHPSAAAAVRAAVAGQDAVVLGFGEIHQTEATAGIPSALRRFTEQILPDLAPELSHLVVETWVTSGRCGEVERAVTADIARTTERPAATENELETLLRRAAAGGVLPRILSVSCADYQAMRPSGGAVDYDRTLRVTERALETATLRALAERRRPYVAVYGGALHNDVHPHPLLGAYSYAPAVLTGTLGRFVELDLVVPEYLDPLPPGRGRAPTAAALRRHDRENQGKYDWWPAYRAAVGQAPQASQAPGERRGDVSSVLLIRRSPRSFVIVFPRVPRPE